MNLSILSVLLSQYLKDLSSPAILDTHSVSRLSMYSYVLAIFEFPSLRGDKGALSFSLIQNFFQSFHRTTSIVSFGLQR